MKKSNLSNDNLEEEVILGLCDLYRNNSYLSTYNSFFKSEGLKKIALGRVLAEKISEGYFFMDVNLIDEFLSSIDIDALWTIASSSLNDELKNLASMKVIAFLDDNIKCKKKVYRKKRKL